MTVRSDVDDMIGFLNSLVAIDRYFVQDLMAQRVPCNRAMAEHPTVQVQGHCAYVPDGQWRAGMLGLINGYFGVIGEGDWMNAGPISAYYEEGKLVRFVRTGTVPLVAEPDPSAAVTISLPDDRSPQQEPRV